MDGIKVLSIDAPYSATHAGEWPPLAAVLPARTGADEDAECRDLYAVLTGLLLDECTPRERLILFYRYPSTLLGPEQVGEVFDRNGDPIRLPNRPPDGRALGMAEIGSLIGITRERVRQLIGEVHSKLRRHLRTRKIEFVDAVKGPHG